MGAPTYDETVDATIESLRQKNKAIVENIDTLQKSNPGINKDIFDFIKSQLDPSSYEADLDKLRNAHYYDPPANHNPVPDDVSAKAVERSEKNRHDNLVTALNSRYTVEPDKTDATEALKLVEDGAGLFSGKAADAINPLWEYGKEQLDSTGGKIGLGIGGIAAFAAVSAVWGNEQSSWWEKALVILAIPLLLFLGAMGGNAAQDFAAKHNMLPNNPIGDGEQADLEVDAATGKAKTTIKKGANEYEVEGEYDAAKKLFKLRDAFRKDDTHDASHDVLPNATDEFSVPVNFDPSGNMILQTGAVTKIKGHSQFK